MNIAQKVLKTHKDLPAHKKKLKELTSLKKSLEKKLLRVEVEIRELEELIANAVQVLMVRLAPSLPRQSRSI